VIPIASRLQTLAAARADGERLAVAEDGWERLLGPLDRDPLIDRARRRYSALKAAA
jgi:hypothetical protein